jgi:hypothetical protein
MIRANTHPPRADGVISRYSRAQAIEDGVLIDVAQTARKAGFRFPVAVTQSVWGGCVEPNEAAAKAGQTVAGRLWDVLWLLRVAVGKAHGKGRLVFKATFQDGVGVKSRRVVSLIAVCGPGDKGEPVITVMLPEDE